jgi:undecaprenyl-diphosphatase
MGAENFIDALISGVGIAVVSWLPVNPDRVMEVFMGGVLSYSPYLGSAYLGVMFSVFYRFRKELTEDSLMALRGAPTHRFQYAFFGALFSLFIGFSLETALGENGGAVFDVINLIVSLFIFLLGVSWPKLTLLRSIEERLPSRPSMLDSIVAGVAQGISVPGMLSRTGFVTLGLALPGHEARDIMELGFIIAPAYHFLLLLGIGNCGSSTVILNLTSALAAFFTSLAVMEVLLRVAERLGSSKFLTLFGIIGVLIETGVVL